MKEVRAGALRALRYLLQSSEVMDGLVKQRIDLLVARSLDATPNKDIERLQAMRFVRQVSIVHQVIFYVLRYADHGYLEDVKLHYNLLLSPSSPPSAPPPWPLPWPSSPPWPPPPLSSLHIGCGGVS